MNGKGEGERRKWVNEEEKRTEHSRGSPALLCLGLAGFFTSAFQSIHQLIYTLNNYSFINSAVHFV